MTSPARRPAASFSLPTLPGLHRHHPRVPVGQLVQVQLVLRSIVAKRSIGGNSLASARIRVVLPAFCSPVTTMFLPARIAARRNATNVESSVPRATRSSRSTSRTRCRRITTCGRGVVHAIAASRDPSSRRRCSRGFAVEKVRSRPADPRCEELQELDELVVGVRDRRTGLLAAVGVGHPDPVVAVDLDVLHVRVVDQRLQPAQPEQRRHHRVGERELLLHAPRRFARVHAVPGPRREDVGQQGAAQLAAGRRVTDRVGLQARGEPLRDLTAHLTHQPVVQPSDSLRLRLRPVVPGCSGRPDLAGVRCGEVLEVPDAKRFGHGVAPAR